MNRQMSRPLADIIAHIRAVCDNRAVDATLIQTEDLYALCDAVELEAADEIERLRGQQLATEADLNMKLSLAYDKVGKLIDERKRLRAALESLTKDPPATLDEPDTDAEVIIKMRAIARAALDKQ